MGGHPCRTVGGHLLRRLDRDERGQSLPVVLTLIAFLFIIGSAMAAQISGALRATAAGEAQGGSLHAAEAGSELGIWWQRNGRPGNPPDITVNGRTVTTRVVVAGGTACPTRTPLLITGFESGAISAAGGGLFSTVTGSGVTADASVARSGRWSLRVVGAAGSASNASLASAGGVSVVRVYLRLASLPAADVGMLLALDAVAGTDLRLGYRAATQRLTLAFGAAAVATATTPISAGTWVRLDIRFAANTNPRTADWRIDGGAQGSISSAEAASTVAEVALGSTIGTDAYAANYDDVMTSATSADFPIGAGAVLPLRPDGMGVSSSPGAFHREDGSAIGATTYQALVDDPMTRSNDFVRQDTVGATSYVEMTMSDTAAGCIVGAAGTVAYHATGPASNNGRTAVLDGATERTIYGGDMSDRTLMYKSAVVAPTGAWTTARVNALRARIGYSTDIAPFNPNWDAFLVEVATGTSVPGTVTVTATAGGWTVATSYPDGGAGAPALESWSASR